MGTADDSQEPRPLRVPHPQGRAWDCPQISMATIVSNSRYPERKKQQINQLNSQEPELGEVWEGECKTSPAHRDEEGGTGSRHRPAETGLITVTETRGPLSSLWHVIAFRRLGDIITACPSPRTIQAITGCGPDLPQIFFFFLHSGTQCSSTHVL